MITLFFFKTRTFSPSRRHRFRAEWGVDQGKVFLRFHNAISILNTRRTSFDDSKRQREELALNAMSMYF